MADNLNDPPKDQYECDYWGEAIEDVNEIKNMCKKFEKCSIIGENALAELVRPKLDDEFFDCICIGPVRVKERVELVHRTVLFSSLLPN